MLDVGRVCFKTSGRTQGDRVVVLDVQQDGRVLVEGLKTKRRPCNPRHLFPTMEKIGVDKKSSRIDIAKQLKEKA